MRMRENPHWGKRVSRDPALTDSTVTLPAWTWSAATVVLVVVLLALQQWVAAAIIVALAILGLFLTRQGRRSGPDGGPH